MRTKTLFGYPVIESHKNDSPEDEIILGDFSEFVNVRVTKEQLREMEQDYEFFEKNPK